MSANEFAVDYSLLKSLIERVNALDSRISKLEAERSQEKKREVPLKGNILYKENK